MMIKLKHSIRQLHYKIKFFFAPPSRYYAALDTSLAHGFDAVDWSTAWPR